MQAWDADPERRRSPVRRPRGCTRATACTRQTTPGFRAVVPWLTNDEQLARDGGRVVRLDADEINPGRNACPVAVAAVPVELVAPGRAASRVQPAHAASAAVIPADSV